MIQYQLVKEAVSAHGTQYDTYGITALVDGKPLTTISDISIDPAAVKRLIDLCNREKLDPIHLDEVIEYFLLA